MIIQDEGIVLRSVDYSNTSQILTIFTKNFGKVAIMAKGIRKISKKKFDPGLEILNYVSFVGFRKSDHQKLITLNEHNLIDFFPGIRKDLQKLFISMYLLELIRECTVEEEPLAPLFNTFQKGLKKLEKSAFPENYLLYIQWHILRMLGLIPQISQCACPRKIKGRKSKEPFYFSSAENVCFCSRCISQKNSAAIAISAQSLCDMIALLEQTNEMEKRYFSATSYRELNLLFQQHIRALTGRQMRTDKYIQNPLGK